jgi:hypothetical protein
MPLFSSGRNIYNSNGTLNSLRTLDIAGFDFTFTDSVDAMSDIVNFRTRRFSAFDGTQIMDTGDGILGYDLSLGEIALDWQQAQAYDPTQIISFDWSTRAMYDPSGIESIYWGNKFLMDTINVVASVEWENRVLRESGNAPVLDWETKTLLSAWALGTPASVTLTNATGLPIAGLVASTVTAIGVGSVELGNASDTTLSRSSAGVLAVEGVVIPSVSSTNTLTNKRMTKRTGTTTSSATPTINTDNVDFYSITAQTVDITSFTTNLSGTPTENQTLWIAITGTAARAITWGASFEASTVALPTTTVTTARLDVGFVWNTVTSKWRCIATA